MSYAGDIGKSQGVKLTLNKRPGGKVGPVAKLTYYAWNNRTMSSPGYGTKKLSINLQLSTGDNVKFVDIDGNGSGDCLLKEGGSTQAGIAVHICQDRKGDHQWNTVIFELSDLMMGLLEKTTGLIYDAYVNDDGNHNHIPGTILYA